MTALRQKMIEDMQLRGFAERTQEAYLSAVRQLAKHYRKPPDQIDEEELRQYFSRRDTACGTVLFLKNEKHAARNTCTIALCGIKFFFQHTLGREWKTFEFLRPAKEKKLPVVLSVEEVRGILKRIERYHYRVCLTTIYACGLRLLEGVHLKVSNIDGQRKMLHIHRAKGNKDRYAVSHRRACSRHERCTAAGSLSEPASPTLADPSQSSVALPSPG
jgi:integrase/recombinase XerD